MKDMRNAVCYISFHHTCLALAPTVTVHVCGDFSLEREGADDGITGPSQIMRKLSHVRCEARPAFKGVTQRIREGLCPGDR